MKLDILVFGAHPDDVELGCGGTIIKEVQNGKKVGVIDLTRGELGTRGTSKTRDIDTRNATNILGIHLRDNMNFDDGFFQKLYLDRKINNLTHHNLFFDVDFNFGLNFDCDFNFDLIFGNNASIGILDLIALSTIFPKLSILYLFIPGIFFMV